MKRVIIAIVLFIYLFSFGLTFNSFFDEEKISTHTEKKGCDEKDIDKSQNTSCDKFYKKDKNINCPQKEKVKTKKFSIENSIPYTKVFSFLIWNGNNDPPGIFDKLSSNLVFTNLFGVVVSLE